MKVTPRLMIRAALVLTAGGVVGFFGACKDSTKPIEPPPPPPTLNAPTGLTAAPVSAAKINLTWTDNAANETGFRVDRCSGAGCTNFAQIGTNLAANATAFSDDGLTASTTYGYRVRAFNATDTSAWVSTNATTLAVGGSGSFTMVGAGEITTCSSSSGPTGTAAIIQPMLADTNVVVFSAGDALSDAAAPNFDCFDSKWGSFKNRTWFALGTGDFTGRGTDATYAYFGDRTGPKGQGYRSFNKGAWHIIILNTTTYELGAPELTNAASAFNTWLVNDLQTNTQPCVLALSWERRLYTTGDPNPGLLGRQSNMNTIAQELYAAGVDLLISANDHLYVRFPQADPDGVVDTNRGFRQFIVGTGGMTTWTVHAPNTTPPAGSKATNAESQGNAWGVLKLKLNDNSYEWEFIPAVAGAFTDKSAAPVSCH